MDLCGAGQYDVAVFCQRAKLVFSRINHNGSKPVNLFGDFVSNIFAVGHTAGKDDGIYLAVYHCAFGDDILGYVKDEGLHEDCVVRAALKGTLLYDTHVIGAEVSNCTAFADEFLFDFLLGVFAAEAHIDKRIRGAAAGALRRDRAVAAKAVRGVDHLAAFVQGNGNAAAHVADDGCGIFCLAAGLTQIPAHDGAGVKGVEQGSALEFRYTADVAFREHFVRHGRICYVRYALAEAGGNAVLLAECVYLFCNLVANQGAQVAGVVAVAA